MAKCTLLIDSMRRKGLTIAACALQTGISTRTLNRYRNGDREALNPGVTEVRCLAQCLGLQTEVLRGAIVAAARANQAARGEQLADEQGEVVSSPALGAESSLVLPLENMARTRDSASLAISSVVAAAFSLPEAAQQLFTESKCPWRDEGEVKAVAMATGAELEKRYAAGGGVAVVDLAIVMHQQLSRWMRDHSYSKDVSHALDTFCGELCIWIGWIAVDAGHGAVAQSYLQEGLLHARMARCHLMEICSLNNLSVLNVRMGDPRRGLKMADLALSIEPSGVPPRLRSLLYLRKAVASAYLNDLTIFRKSASLAHQEFGRGERDDEPTWFRSFSANEITGLLGWGQLVLGQGAEASESFRLTAAALAPDSRRALTHYKIQEARAMTLDGNSAEAAEYALAVLPEVVGIRSALVRQDFQHLYNALQRKNCARSRDFVTAYRDVVGSTVA